MRSETQRLLADKKINGSVLMAAGCGAIPISYIDVGSTMAVQIKMLKDLCDIYEVEWDDHVVKGLLASTAGNIGKRMGASMLKSIPIIGTVVGGFANATLSGISTYVIGHAFVRYMNANAALKSVKDIDMKVFSGMGADAMKQATGMVDTIKKRFFKQSESGSEEGTLIEYGEKTLGSSQNFSSWLNTENPILGGSKPVDLLLSDNEDDRKRLRSLLELMNQKSHN